MESPSSNSAIEMLLTNPSLLDNLRKGYLGNYGVILSLLGCLDHGLEAKKLVDRIIDSCRSFVKVLRLAHLILQVIMSQTCARTFSRTG
jgi:hypothetical protein